MICGGSASNETGRAGFMSLGYSRSGADAESSLTRTRILARVALQY